ncbi:carboxylate--amine ligase [Actinotalea sp.]|uniref:carboxylate--amine ligase n=1 Tax=Actinotalea sp. TaxID=1872145 RepID=UPI002CA3A388|nr:carboxylate--amine ligase [Actinotalea sp.]HRA51743.1 carboxylate--amine ligase [Actinotalea sp.]
MAAVPTSDLQPVILGGDIGAYSLARTFHEAYGVRPVVVSTVATGLVRHSRILTNVVEPRIDQPDVVVARLRAIAAEHAGKRLILLGSADWLVRTIVENRDRLEDLYVVPYVQRDVLDRVTDKESFGRLCGELGLGHPATVVHDVGSDTMPDTSTLRFPVIAKTGDTAAYHRVEFPGKKKVFTVGSPAELHALLGRVKASGYRAPFIIQDLIPGDDSGMRILTCYCDRTGRMRFASYGQVLLEEHTPGALGNPAGIVTGGDGEIVEQARRLLEHIGWTGWANFDLKADPRDGRTVFFELNPRLGRSNFYITAAGRNTAEPYVREYLEGLSPLADGEPEQLTTAHLYTVLPRRLLLRYIADPALRARVRGLMRAGRATNPLWYRAERDPRRIAYLVIAQLNQFRKYRRHYPVAAWREIGRA